MLDKKVIPKRVKTIVFCDDYSRLFKPRMFRKRVRSIRFTGGYSQEIKPNVLPQRLHTLTGLNLLSSILPGSLPASLTRLGFGGYPMSFTHGSLPDGLLELANLLPLDPLVPGLLPSTLQTLSFAAEFDQEITPGLLPPSLRSLYLGMKFNQRILVDVLPSSITSLTFGSQFNKPIAQLPPHLLALIFIRGEYNLPLPTLPVSLTVLNLGYKFNQPIQLPVGLKSLTVNLVPNNSLVALLPTTLRSLRALTFSQSFNTPITIDALPDSLTSLEFGYSFDHEIIPNSLPNSITDLKFGASFHQEVFQSGALPTSLLYLTLRRNDIRHDMRLPSSITSLSIYRFIWKECYPKNLQHLTILSDSESITKRSYLNLNTLTMELQKKKLKITLKLYNSLYFKIPNVANYYFNFNSQPFSTISRIGGSWILITTIRDGVTVVQFYDYTWKPRPKSRGWY
ncbi:hypothetical protein SAMD00019534_108500 [Acytostelium subglobosum LB1]|uniref:hypothetical protein n=1 Tax=Acytostelium subglobosum LB1 TaxID=1410327 RepID=UPI0006448900|nr:hypothetical protein SAMD00019534_108500 [Acytostelium subglobosum LB1]GAM27674.1 hypothetical protein SAMD00019534_108500 [Acytostelium subglobosum LB1]|eukprot:XP_012749333.1 hypothetical protein SAMD00019534_108500 [Acytostelium subglobosum LB1]